jgi:hypothetical protein
VVYAVYMDHRLLVVHVLHSTWRCNTVCVVSQEGALGGVEGEGGKAGAKGNGAQKLKDTEKEAAATGTGAPRKADGNGRGRQKGAGGTKVVVWAK